VRVIDASEASSPLKFLEKFTSERCGLHYCCFTVAGLGPRCLRYTST